MTTTPHTLQEKTTAMKEAIRMAKEVHETPERAILNSVWNNERREETVPQSTRILDTAKQIYDWLTA